MTFRRDSSPVGRPIQEKIFLSCLLVSDDTFAIITGPCPTVPAARHLTYIWPYRSLFSGSEPMQTQCTFRQGGQIDQPEAAVGLLQKYWKTFAPRDVHQWTRRIANADSYLVAAYFGDVIAGVLEGLRLNVAGDPSKVPATFGELTADGTWSTHRNTGDTVVLVDLTIAPEYHGAGLFEAFVQFARKTFESPSGVILTYSPLFWADKRYWVIRKHEQLGARLVRELTRSRPGLTMPVAGKELLAEDVGIAAYPCV